MWSTPGTVPSLHADSSPTDRDGNSTSVKTTTAATRAAVARAILTAVQRFGLPCRRLERGRLVGALPGEFRFRSPEMTERRRLFVNRSAQIELLHDAARREFEVRADHLGDLLFG